MQISTKTPPPQPVPAAGQTAGQAAESPLYSIGYGALLLLLFIVFSRMAETIAVVTGANLRLAMGLLLISIGVAVIQRDAIRRCRNRTGILLFVLTAWFLFCVPTSVHKGGSVRYLLTVWASTLITAICVLIYPSNTASLRRILYAISAGILLVTFARTDEASVFTLGALGNPNLYGQHLLYGVPFLALPIVRNGLASIKSVIAAACAAVLIVKVLNTGSRASLIAIFILGLVFFANLPVLKKLLAIVCMIPAVAIVLIALPEQARQRYGTIFSSDGIAHTTEETSAIESGNARRRHLEQSIDLTIRNPIFGVGPGMFPVASASYSAELGEKAFWKETHNSFTQISSETGLIGLILYLAMLLSATASLWHSARVTRRAPPGSELQEAGQIANMLLISMLAIVVTGMFSSSAYLQYFPLLCAFAAVIARIVEANSVPVASRPRPSPTRPQQPKLFPTPVQNSMPGRGLSPRPFQGES